MKEKTVSIKHAVAIITMFMLGTNLILCGNGLAKQDSWIAMLLSVCMAVPMFFVFARIMKLYPGKDLYDIVILLFGKFVGKTIVVLYTLFSLYLGALVFRSFTDFIKTVATPQTPSIPIVILIGLLTVYAVKSGLETFGKCALFLLCFMITLVLIITVLVAKDMDFSNLLPIGRQGVKIIATSAFESFSFPFAESVLFLCIASCLPSEASPYKAYYTALLITGLLLTITTLRNISVFGYPILTDLYYPSYAIMQIVSVGDFITRIEGTVSSVFIVAGFVKISVCLFAYTKGLTKLFNFDNYRQMVFPAFLTMIAFSRLTFRTAMAFYEDNSVYPYYSLPFLVVLPIVILIAAEIKHRKKTFANQAH